jgi:hypothetical protein
VILKVRYIDFWPGFVPEDFLMTELVRKMYPKSKVEIVTNKSTYVDLEICSVFTFNSLADKVRARVQGATSKEALRDYVCRTDFGHRPTYANLAKKRIWYTCENLRPPQELFDGTISYDKTDYAANNLYFPFFYNSIDWFSKSDVKKSLVKPETLVEKRTIEKVRALKACSFASNLAPNRERLISIVNQIFPVDAYGKSVGKFVASKPDVASRYIFQICNENSQYPGYVTEKLIEAWNFGNVPIWTGNLESNLSLNKKSFIDLTGMITTEIHELLTCLDQSDIEELQTAPLMTEIPSIEPLRIFLESLLESS